MPSFENLAVNSLDSNIQLVENFMLNSRNSQTQMSEAVLNSKVRATSENVTSHEYIRGIHGSPSALLQGAGAVVEKRQGSCSSFQLHL